MNKSPKIFIVLALLSFVFLFSFPKQAEASWFSKAVKSVSKVINKVACFVDDTVGGHHIGNNCNGSGKGNSAPAPINGYCGSFNNTVQTSWDAGISPQWCASGSAANVSSRPSPSGWIWNCNGSNGGISSSCSARMIPPITSYTCSPSPKSTTVGSKVTWTASISGGLAPYVFRWSDITNIIDPSNSSIVIRNYKTSGIKNMSLQIKDGADQLTRWIQCSTSVLVGDSKNTCPNGGVYPDCTSCATNQNMVGGICIDSCVPNSQCNGNIVVDSNKCSTNTIDCSTKGKVCNQGYCVFSPSIDNLVTKGSNDPKTGVIFNSVIIKSFKVIPNTINAGGTCNLSWEFLQEDENSACILSDSAGNLISKNDLVYPMLNGLFYHVDNVQNESTYKLTCGELDTSGNGSVFTPDSLIPSSDHIKYATCNMNPISKEVN